MRFLRTLLNASGLRRVCWLVACLVVLLPYGQVLADTQPLSVGDVFSITNNSEFYDPTANGTCGLNGDSGGSGGDTQGGATSQADATIVLDPGHAPGTDVKVDPESNVAVMDYENEPEMKQVWDVAQKLQSKLEADGYNVIMTKSSLNDSSTDLRKRAEVANDANASLVVSIHTTPGSPTNGNDIFVPKVGEYLETADGKKKLTYKNDDLAATDMKYAKIMKGTREAAENDTVQAGGYGDIYGVIDRSEGGITEKGTMLVSQYFAKVPWLYNEIYQDKNAQNAISDEQEQNYVTGMLKGIEKIVPLNGNSSSDGTGVTGSLAMQEVDLTNFKPDQQAVNFFNNTILPKAERFIPLYVQAAQAEGVPQNWEILPALQAPETGLSKRMVPSSDGLGAGPWQESFSSLGAYVKSPVYGPVMSQMFNEDGTLKPGEANQTLTDDQFVVLARIVFKNWIAQVDNYGALKDGPIPFNPNIDSSNVWYQIMSHWNPGAVLQEGFPGYDADHPWDGGYRGSATWYYLFKQWEANGGTVTTASSNCAASTGGPIDCSNAQGDAKILCAAQRYKGIWYRFGGGHEAVSAYQQNCPDPTNPTNNQSGGDGGNPSPCAVDCSSLVSLAVDDAFGQNFMWTVNESDGQMSQPEYWQSVTIDQAQPGDIVTKPGHVEIFVSYNAQSNTITSFGAHHTGTQVGEVKTIGEFTQAYHYIGPGGS